MVVTLFVHDLSSNPIVRAVPLALALQERYDVEVVGLLHRDEVYAPYRDVVDIRPLRCSLDTSSVLAALPRLAEMARGDVVYACKPLVPTLGAGLLAARRGRRRPLLLDVEDDEWVPMGEGMSGLLRRDLIGGWRHATAWKYTRMLHPMVRCADGVTVSSRRLQQRYGGVILRHGPDERTFDPAKAPNPREARARFGLPADAPLALFAGMPQRHKGFDTLRAALRDPRAAAWHLVLAGSPTHDEFVACAEALGNRCHRVGLVGQADMPALVAAVDAVPVPQRRMRFAESQIPAKAIEAMAMGRAVIATRVGDLPEILGDGARGWLVDPDNPVALAGALAEIAANRAEAARRGAAARDWFIRTASRRAIAEALFPLLDRAIAARN